MAETKSLTLKELAKSDELLAGGHRLCPGCGHSVTVRQILHAAENPVVVATATGCLEVCTSVFPYTSWRLPWIHTAFENAGATISGVEAMYQARKKRGQIKETIRFVAFAGDGATYDIGLQALSGALERGHDFTYICLNNEAYMNTGDQRSSASPYGADTTTTPAGSAIQGKQQHTKDLTAIVVAHNIPYAAQASPSHWKDLTTKARKAMNITGATFINVMSPCPRGWRSDAALTIEYAKLAVDTCLWPLYEVEDGVYKLNYKPKTKLPITEFMKGQGRFKHLFKKGNEGLIETLQAKVDRDWERLRGLCGE